MRRLAAALCLTLVGCSAVLGVDDFKVRPVAVIAPDAATDAAAAECAVNADCASRGEHYICRKADRACVSLESQDCKTIVGDYKNDHAIILGSLLPTSGPDRSTGVPIENALVLALQDFHGNGDLPPPYGATARRPLVLVSCSDASDEDVAVRAAKHLVDDLRVPAILGAAFSGITLKVATNVTIPAGTLLISPSATSTALTGLQDNGLVWRTSPSDVIQAKAHVAFLRELEKDIVGSPPTREIKIAIANKGDPYGRGLAEAVSATLTFNGGKTALSQIATPPTAGKFATFDYGDAAPNYAGAATQITTQLPDIVFLFGTTETLTEMMKAIELGWPTPGPPRPRYILADGSLVAEATEIANGTPATPDAANGGLRRRILGTIPGTTNENFVKFQNLYNSMIKDGTSPATGGAANAYDALYNLAFAMVAADHRPLTGAILRDGFARQVDKASAPLDVGFANINEAFKRLAAGQSFDFNGASGPLDYDLATGEASSDIQLWCLPPAPGGGAGAGRATSVFFNAQSGVLEEAGAPKLGLIARMKKECEL